MSAAGGLPPDRLQSGFALVVVLWIVALLALAASILASAMSAHLDITRNDIERTRGALIADAGINLAMREMLTQPALADGRRFAPGGAGHTCLMPEGEVVTIRVEDEAGKVDLNVASDDLLRALLLAIGISEDRANALVDAIADYRDADDERRLNGAEAVDYVAAGRVGPKNSLFESVVEIGGVLGVDAPILQQLRPYLTVHSEQPGIDPDAASPELIKMLAAGAGARFDGPLGISASGAPRDAIPARFIATTAGRAYTIRSLAILPSGLQVARRAIVARIDGIGRSARPRPGDEPLAENMSRPRPRDGQPRASRLALRIVEWGRDSVSLSRPPISAPAPQC